MKIYRCLNCDTHLRLKTIRAKVRKDVPVIECPRCQVRYDRNFIVRSDPNLWEKVRHDKNFTISIGGNVMRIPQQLGKHPKVQAKEEKSAAKS